jgi:hypothetical protein
MSELNEEDFRRLTGIKRQTFERMIEILSIAEEKKKKLGGKPNTLGLEARLLMALSFILARVSHFFPDCVGVCGFRKYLLS